MEQSIEELIVEKVKGLPRDKALEDLDFIEFLERKTATKGNVREKFRRVTRTVQEKVEKAQLTENVIDEAVKWARKGKDQG